MNQTVNFFNFQPGNNEGVSILHSRKQHSIPLNLNAALVDLKFKIFSKSKSSIILSLQLADGPLELVKELRINKGTSDFNFNANVMQSGIYLLNIRSTEEVNISPIQISEGEPQK